MLPPNQSPSFLNYIITLSNCLRLLLHCCIVQNGNHCVSIRYALNCIAMLVAINIIFSWFNLRRHTDYRVAMPQLCTCQKSSNSIISKISSKCSIETVLSALLPQGKFVLYAKRRQYLTYWISSKLSSVDGFQLFSSRLLDEIIFL